MIKTLKYTDYVKSVRRKNKMEKRKILILGAGPAGLTAAYNLSKNKDYEITILEEDKQVGGISKTINYNGNRMDLGGHRFFTKDERINSLWQEIFQIQGKPSLDDKILDNKKNYKENGADPETEDDVFLIRHRVSRIYFLKKFFDYPISLKMKTIKNMGLGRTIGCGFGYIHSCMFKRKERSLEDFYINRFGKPLYKLFFKDYTTKLWGVTPDKLSSSWGSQRVKGLSLWKALTSTITKHFKKKEVETSLIEEFLYPKYGPGQFFEKMQEIIQSRNVKVIFNSKVNRIEYDDKGNISKVITLDNKEFIADYYISSLPIKDLFLFSNENRFNKEIYNIAVNLPYRDFITVGLLLKELKIKNNTKIKTINNLIPDDWIYIQEKDVKVGRIQIFNNWSPYMVKKPLENVWLSLEYFASEGDNLWSLNDKDFINFAIEELIKISIISSKDEVLDSTRVKVKKAYPAYFGTYDDFDKVKEELNKINNLYCIGRNGQHRYNNMDHSMLTGLIATDNIMNNIQDKESIWNVNTEKSYHESKENEKQ